LYTKRVLNIGEFDPMACKVLVLELANNIAPSIIGSKAEKKQDQIQKELTKKVLPDAKKANAFEEIVPAERRENSGSWATARFVGTIPPNF
jgi:Na+-translocating ferredoxin:NAD+ oxidoreductase RnfG subunit